MNPKQEIGGNMDLNLFTILALQQLNQSLNYDTQSATPEVPLPEIDYAQLAVVTRPRSERTEQKARLERGGKVTPAGVCCM
jgi:hypothetical protein